MQTVNFGVFCKICTKLIIKVVIVLKLKNIYWKLKSFQTQSLRFDLWVAKTTNFGTFCPIYNKFEIKLVAILKWKIIYWKLKNLTLSDLRRRYDSSLSSITIFLVWIDLLVTCLSIYIRGSRCFHAFYLFYEILSIIEAVLELMQISLTTRIYFIFHTGYIKAFEN